MKQTYYLIGGVSDGQRVEIDDSENRLRTSEQEGFGITEITGTEISVYTRRRLHLQRSGEKTIRQLDYFAEEKFRDDEALTRLLSGYRQPLTVPRPI